MILLFLAFFNENVETLISTDIFTPVFSHNFVMSPDSRLYLLDSSESQVRIYSPKNRLLKTFGQKGQGPEDLTYPVRLNIFGDQLHVSQAFKKTVFDLDGNFLGVYITPKDFLTLATPNGWLTLSLSKTAYVFKLYSHDGSRERVIFKLDRPENSGRPSMENPFPNFTLNAAGTRAYITETNAFKVFIVDLAQGSVITSFERQTTLIPISDEWKKEKLKMLKQQIRRVDPKREIELRQFPKYFPPIRSIETGPGGKIFVFTFNPHNPVHTFDEDGQTSSSYIKSLEAFRQVFSIKGKWAYLCNMVNDEAVVVRVPKDKIEDYLKTN